MARVTIEDCINHVPNSFELVVLAAQRVRQISAGAPLTVNRNNDKNPVVALREIAEKTVSAENLKENAIKSFRRHTQVEPEEEEFAELFSQAADFDKTSLSNHEFREELSDNLIATEPSLQEKDTNEHDNDEDLLEKEEHNDLINEENIENNGF